jgi:hypothetical protein
MANARCQLHSQDLVDNATRNRYVARAQPLNYPNTAAICGRRCCDRPALIHLDEEEWRQYQMGQRLFNPHTYTVKIQVSEQAERITS